MIHGLMSTTARRSRAPRPRSLTNPTPLRTINVPQEKCINNGIDSQQACPTARSLRTLKRKTLSRKAIPFGISSADGRLNSSNGANGVTNAQGVKKSGHLLRRPEIPLYSSPAIRPLPTGSPKPQVQAKSISLVLSCSFPTLAFHKTNRSQLVSANLPPLMTHATITAETSSLDVNDSDGPLSLAYPLKDFYAALRSRRQMVLRKSGPRPLSVSQVAPHNGPTIHVRRHPLNSQLSPIQIVSNHDSYALSVQLPSLVQHEMITVYAKKGDRLAIVADAWHVTMDSRCEWEVCFAAHDVDMSSIKAIFDGRERLNIDVTRIAGRRPYT